MKTKPKKQTSALDCAKFLMSLDPKRKYFTKKEGNFRLNTMLHISQMLHCAKTGEFLFKKPLIAFPPNWQKLSEKGQKELTNIIKNLEIKNKKELIRNLYQTKRVELN